MESATDFLEHFYSWKACLLTGGFHQIRYGRDRIERLDVYTISICTSSEKPIFDADKLKVENKYFPNVKVKKSVVLHGP